MGCDYLLMGELVHRNNVLNMELFNATINFVTVHGYKAKNKISGGCISGSATRHLQNIYHLDYFRWMVYPKIISRLMKYSA